MKMEVRGGGGGAVDVERGQGIRDQERLRWWWGGRRVNRLAERRGDIFYP